MGSEMRSDSADKETYSDAETEARREAALKRMLATPHKPHAPLHAALPPEFVVLDGQMYYAEVTARSGNSMVANLYRTKADVKAGRSMERAVALEAQSSAR